MEEAACRCWLKISVDPIVRQYRYLFQYESNIQNLEDELNKLQEYRKRVRIQINAALFNLQRVDPALKLWVQAVNKIEKTASVVSEKTSNVNKRRLKNVWCPSVKCRYLLSRNAYKLTRGIGILQREGRLYVSLTCSVPSPQETRRIISCEDLESRKVGFNRVMDALKDDTIRMIGISGPKGVGKTTFVKEVQKAAELLGSFDGIAMIKVSQKPDPVAIQDLLAKLLGLTFTNEKTILARAQTRHSRLTNGRRSLVILDDICEKFELKHVGIPETSDYGECKVIVTSRIESLVSDMGVQLNVIIEPLNYQESWDLFKEILGDYEQHDRASEIVRTCKGIPLAIVSITKTLRKAEAAVWDSALNHLQQTATTINYMRDYERKILKQYVGKEISRVDEEAAYKSVELSYNLLKDQKAKSLLVLCCLFQEDANISLKTLFRFDCCSDLEVRRSNVSNLVGKLRSLNLLGEGKSPSTTVKVHDIVRDVCLSTERLDKWPSPSFSLADQPYAELENRCFKYKKSTYEELWGALNDDQIHTIEMIGMPRVGKTTMMLDIKERLLADNHFDEVALISVSQDVDMSKIQAELGGILGLTSTIWDKGDFNIRAQLLRERLTNGSRIIVVLDDVWESFDVESIGVPVRGDRSGCKLVIITQLINIFREIRVQKRVRFNVMAQMELWELFRKYAAGTDRDTSEAAIFEHIAGQILNECGGIPFAVVEIAYTLKNQGINKWTSTLKKLRNTSKEFVTYTTEPMVLLQSLRYSYEGLRNPQAQLLLLLCCKMEANASIPIGKLVMSVHKVQLFEDALGLEEALIKVQHLAELLQNASLLLANDKDGKHGTIRVPFCVKQMCLLLLQTPFNSIDSAPPTEIMNSASLLPELTIATTDAAPSIKNCEDFESRKSIFKEVMDALKDDRIRMIGISGTGGVGKTTFVNEICENARAQSLFEQFPMATVSQKSDLFKIQDELAEMLGFKFAEEKNFSERAHDLHYTLTDGRKFLVILDDIWQEIPLKKIGIPEIGDHGGCKVIFTSRVKNLLSDMGTQVHVTVKGFSSGESRDLFEANLGGYKQHHTASDIVGKCRGLPIAIVTVARAIRKELQGAMDSDAKFLPK